VPIGNGLAVSALQMLGAYSIVGAGGVWRAPHIVGATVDGAGRRTPVEPRPPRRVVSEETADQVREMLRSVVDIGTGSNAAIAGYSVAGKTGTARKPLVGARGYSGEYVASFAGFVPAEAPRLAAVVVLDEPRPIYGGQVAAPVFSRIMSYALRLERIPPPPVPSMPPLPAAAQARTPDSGGGGGTLPAGTGGTSTAPQGDGRREPTPAPGR
jgi:cell division protein FtsI/penicillin-binding protein 2